MLWKFNTTDQETCACACQNNLDCAAWTLRFNVHRSDGDFAHFFDDPHARDLAKGATSADLLLHAPAVLSLDDLLPHGRDDDDDDDAGASSTNPARALSGHISEAESDDSTDSDLAEML